VPDGVLPGLDAVRSALADHAADPFDVQTIVNANSQAMRVGIEDFLAERAPGDHVVLYLAGHTMMDARNRLIFAGTDTRPDRPASTAVEAEWLADRLSECPARSRVIIVDADHSGAFVRVARIAEDAVVMPQDEIVDDVDVDDVDLDVGAVDRLRVVRPDAVHGQARVLAILTSGTADQTADGGTRHGAAGPSPFTEALARVLTTGAADADGDGVVTVEEAYAYIRQRVASAGSPLTPCRWISRQDDVTLVRVGTVDDPHPESQPLSDVAHAVRVAKALDPAQALAAVQGLDAAQLVDVAQAFRIPRVLEPDAVHPRSLDARTLDDLPVVRRPIRATGPRRRQIGEVLVEHHVITQDQLDAAHLAQRDAPSHRWIGKVVVDLGMADERDVAECLAHMLHLDVLDLSDVVPSPEVVRLLPRAVAERIHVLVIDRNPRGELVVAASDPTNVLAFDDVRLYTRSADLKIYVATDSQIRDQLNRAWSLGTDSSHVAEIVQEVSGGEEEQDQWPGASADDAPIVRLVTQILEDGVRSRASDIHIEVQRYTLRVRYRVDGLLREVMEAPKRVSSSVISRIKIVSGLDIAERRIPQDGRTRFTVDGTMIDARVSTLPSLHGEKVVIRLLTRGDAIPTLPALGLEPDQLTTVEAALAVPQGLILITGPTGSGKTNTLYSAIAKVRSPELNIVTLEDPVEVQLPGITQVGVNEKSGMTFSRGLRSILRQDPDIILVGEVRDSETAQLALKAAMTGHMVLTTLHTNSAVAALTRLVDLGAEPFIIASSLTVSIAQRLVRCPCQHCVAPYRPDTITLTLLGLVPDDLLSATPCKGTGCHECGGTGYRGRTAVYEVLDVDGPMREVLMKEPTEAAITAQARAAGMVSLRTAAILKALHGQTTFEEAARVTSR
jgi:type IV pilus assembly protein PilB